MGTQLRKEFLEGGVELGLHGLKIAHGRREFDVVAAGLEAGGHAGEGEGDAIEGGVGGEPVVGEEGVDGIFGTLGEEVFVLAERGVGGGDRVLAGVHGVAVPFEGEDVVKEDVDEDGGVAGPVWFEEVGAAVDEGVEVGEGVDSLMNFHAAADGFGEGEACAAFDPVGGEVPEEGGGVVGRGEEGVGEEVHGIT